MPFRVSKSLPACSKTNAGQSQTSSKVIRGLQHIAAICLLLWISTLGASIAAAAPISLPSSLACRCYSATADDIRKEGGCGDYFEHNWKVYLAWRRHVELIRYDARKPNSPAFTQIARNVTPEDEVYLEIVNSNPLLWTHDIKVTSEDAPAQPLLVVSGAAPSAISISGDQAKTNANDAATNVEKAQPTGAKQQMLNQTLQQQVIESLGNTKTPGKKPPLTPAEQRAIDITPAFDIERDRFNSDLTGYSKKANDLRLDTNMFQEAVRELQFRLEALAQRDTVANNNWPNAVDELFDCTGKPNCTISLEVLRIQAEKVHHDFIILSSAYAVLMDQSKLLSDRFATPFAAAAADLREHRGPDVPHLQEMIDFIDNASAAVGSLDGSMKTLRTSLHDDIDSALHAEAVALGEAKTAAADTERCILLGKFPGGKRITVQITARQRGGDGSQQTDTGTKTTKNDKKKPKRTNALFSASGTRGSAGAKGSGGSGSGGGGDTSGGTGNQGNKPQELDPNMTSFDVLSVTHISVTLGFAVSGLSKPTFDFRSQDVAASGTTPAQKQITIFRKSDGSYQVRPVVHLALYPFPRYLFAEADGGDRWESVRPWQRWVPYPAIGFSLTDPTQNYFVGGGFDLFRGISIIGGIHFGKVDRLLTGYSENTSFLVPATSTFKVADAVETRFRNSWYFSIGIEPATLLKALGNSSNGKK